MSSARMEVDMLLNAKGVAEGANDAKKSLTDLEDAIGDVATESGKAGGKIDSFANKVERAVEDIGDELKATGRDGERAGEKLEDALREVQKQSEKTERSVDDIGSQGFGKMGEAAQEVTQEVGSNLGEAVSSIRGDLSDLGQVGQDTLGGLAATLASTGPAGIAGAAALAAGAVGLGLVTAEIEAQNERVQRLKEYFAEAWQEAVDGGKTYIDTATVIGEMQDIIFNPDRADEYKKIQDDANKLSLDWQTLLRAASGDQEALNVVTERANDLLSAQEEITIRSEDIRTKGRGPKEAAASRELADLQALNERWELYGQINDENRQKAEDSAAFTSQYLLDTIANADSATRAVDDFGNKLITLPDGQEIVIDAKTGQASTDIEKFKTDTDEVIEDLNAKDVTLAVKAAVRQAQDDVNRFIMANDGKSFRLNGRVTVDSGWNE